MMTFVPDLTQTQKSLDAEKINVDYNTCKKELMSVDSGIEINTCSLL